MTIRIGLLATCCWALGAVCVGAATIETSAIVTDNSNASEPDTTMKDPTQPSDEIAERLRGVAPPAPISAPESGTRAALRPLPVLRLKAMVRHGDDSGTALISTAGGRDYMVSLRSERAGQPSPLVNLEGLKCRVVDFSASAVTLRCEETGRQILVN